VNASNATAVLVVCAVFGGVLWYVLEWQAKQAKVLSEVS